jgi:predicted component of type VI protein secretion system
MEAAVTIVREMADAIHLLADLVRDTQELTKAINDGRGYLAREHPEAKKDLAEMLSQMQTTVEGLADVTSVVTGFRFTTTGAAVDFEPARFNKYVIAQKKKVTTLRGKISKLKGSCGKVGKARDKLNDLAGDKSDWAAMFRLFGKRRREMNTRLAGSLSNYYADDQRMIELIETILNLSQAALNEADEALGPAGMASPYSVGTAAAVLNVYAAAFKQSEADLAALVKTLEGSVDALR